MGSYKSGSNWRYREVIHRNRQHTPCSTNYGSFHAEPDVFPRRARCLEMRVLVHESKMLMYDAARNMQCQSWELFVVEFQPSNGKWRVDVATAKSVPQRNTKTG